MHIYDGNINALRAPEIKLKHLVDLVLEGVIRPLAQRQGLDCVLKVIWKRTVVKLLTDAERYDMVQLLDRLPPLNDQMTTKEKDDFLNAYDQLPDKLPWQPLINYQVKSGPVLVNLKPGIEEPRHRSLLADAVYRRYGSNRTGIDCITHKQEIEERPEAFSDLHREALLKLLQQNSFLPRPHAQMSSEDVNAFMRAFRNLADRPDWEPVFIREEDRQRENEEREKIRTQEIKRIKDAFTAKQIKFFDGDGIEASYLSNEVWTSPSYAVAYLRGRGVFEKLERKYASSHPQQEIKSNKKQDETYFDRLATYIQKSGKAKTVVRHIGAALRAKQCLNVNTLYKWMLKEAKAGKLDECSLNSLGTAIRVAPPSGKSSGIFDEKNLSGLLGKWRKYFQRDTGEIL